MVSPRNPYHRAITLRFILAVRLLVKGETQMEKISISWFDDKKSVLLVTYNEEGWTWEDLFAALKQQNVLIDSVDQPAVDVVVDVRNARMVAKIGEELMHRGIVFFLIRNPTNHCEV